MKRRKVPRRIFHSSVSRKLPRLQPIQTERQPQVQRLIHQSTEPAPNLPALPAEMWLRIFSFLTPEDLTARVWPVCTHWRDLVEAEFFYKELSFYRHSVSTQEVLQLLRAAPELRSVKLSERKDATEILREVSESNRKLCKLVVEKCQSSAKVSTIPAMPLLRLLKHCEGITDLTISHTRVTSLKFYNQLGKVLPELRRINFTGSRVGTVQMMRMIEGCSGLEELRAIRDLTWRDPEELEDCWDVHVIKLCSKMSVTLQVVELNAMLLTDRSMEALSTCHRLHMLRLTWAEGMTDRGLAHLATLPSLTTLQVYGSESVTASGWAQFFKVSPSSRQLQEVHSDHCMDDSVIAAIAAECPALRILDISHCGIDNYEPVIRSCKELRQLSVEESNHALKLIPKCTPALEKLCISALPGEDFPDILRSLRKALPKLYVKTYYKEYPVGSEITDILTCTLK